MLKYLCDGGIGRRLYGKMLWMPIVSIMYGANPYSQRNKGETMLKRIKADYRDASGNLPDDLNTILECAEYVGIEVTEKTALTCGLFARIMRRMLAELKEKQC